MEMILGKYPVNNESEIKEASSYFNEHILKFEPKQRVKIAKEMHTVCLLKKVPIEKNASYNAYFNFCYDGDSNVNSEYLKVNIEDRKNLVEGVKIAEKDASEVLDEILSISDKLTIDKVAGLLHDFDMETGVAEEWDLRIRDPFVSVSTNSDSGKNVFAKTAALGYDVIDIHNLSCDSNLVKTASSVVDDDMCESFIKNPYNFMEKESGLAVNAFFEAIDLNSK